MPCPFPEHHKSSGGSGIGAAVAVVLAAIAAVRVAGPVVHAAAELVRAALIIGAVILGLAVVGLAALVAWRLRQGRQNAPLVVHQVPPVTHRAAESLPAPPRSVAALPAPGRPAELHLHFHGVSAEELAAIVREHARDNGSGAP